MQLEFGQQFESADDYPIDLSNATQVDAYLEGGDLRGKYADAIATTKKAMKTLFLPFNEDNYFQGLSENLTQYLTFYDLERLYELENTTKRKWAETISSPEMTAFLTKKIDEVKYR